VEENKNLVEEDEGIQMMASEGITLDNDMVLYLDVGANNHMCGHKHLFVDILEIEDGHVSFGDSTKVSIKGREKNMFFPKRWKNMYYGVSLLCTWLEK